ncbi:hypothetical protein [Streptomyces sp. NPDC006645]|uniref:hypothetical protein n=1 Tax=unclassified Streptomyces TaxID=2593676 RepID=UPI00339FF184
MRTARRPLTLLLVLLAALLTALTLRGRGPEPGYAEGYDFGRDKGPRGHLGGADPSDTGAAMSECGEHAETDGIRTTTAWTAGCVDGALGLPKSPPAS